MDIEQNEIGNWLKNADETISLRGGNMTDPITLIISRDIIGL
jgi:hypothetical protein